MHRPTCSFVGTPRVAAQMWPSRGADVAESCGVCDDAQAKHGGEYPSSTPLELEYSWSTPGDVQAEHDRLWAQSQPALVQRATYAVRLAVTRMRPARATLGCIRDWAHPCAHCRLGLHLRPVCDHVCAGTGLTPAKPAAQ